MTEKIRVRSNMDLIYIFFLSINNYWRTGRYHSKYYTDYIVLYDCTVYKNTDIHSIRRSSNCDIVSTDDDLENSSLLIQRRGFLPGRRVVDWRLHYLMNNAIGIVQEYREIAQ